MTKDDFCATWVQVVAIKPTPHPKRNSLNIIPMPTSKQQYEVFLSKKQYEVFSYEKDDFNIMS